MSRRGMAALLTLSVLLSAAALWWLLSWSPTEDDGDEVTVEEQPSEIGPIEEDDPIRLFFPGGDGLLHVEEREVAAVEASSSLDALRRLRAESVVEGLLQEPRREGSRRAFAEGTSLAEVRLVAGGLAIVSLQPPPGEVEQGDGSRAELLRVYSLVNSLAYSVPGVRSVQIVWGGRQPNTFAGHVDTTWPLKPSLDWVAGAGRLRRGAGDGPAGESG